MAMAMTVVAAAAIGCWQKYVVMTHSLAFHTLFLAFHLRCVLDFPCR